jgi:hypothetical protein
MIIRAPRRIQWRRGLPTARTVAPRQALVGPIPVTRSAELVALKGPLASCGTLTTRHEICQQDNAEPFLLDDCGMADPAQFGADQGQSCVAIPPELVSLCTAVSCSAPRKARWRTNTRLNRLSERKSELPCLSGCSIRTWRSPSVGRPCGSTALAPAMLGGVALAQTGHGFR